MKWLLVIVGVLLAISVIGNGIGYRYTHKTFEKYNGVLLDPLGINFAPQPAGLDSLWDAVLIGDSHASNWRFPKGKTLNLGIGGQTSSQIKLRSDLCKSRLRGGTLIIIAGANDLNCISAYRARKNEIVGNCLSCLSAIIDNHRGNFKDIWLSTVLPEFNPPLEHRLLYCKEIDEALDEINTGIRSLAKEKGVKLLDSYAVIESRMKTENLSSDGVHLNQKAYDYLCNEINRQVTNISDTGRVR